MPALVLTLIVEESARSEVERWARMVATALAAAGARPSGPDWLEPQRVFDLAIEDLSPWASARTARAALPPGAPFDLVVQPAARRKKRLLVADLESTVIANEMLDEMADLLGFGARVAAITQRAMNGELDFAASLKERVALFKDQPASLVLEAAKRIRINPGAAALVRTMKAAGARTILVSGGFHVFANALAESLGFDRVHANELAMEDGRLSGTVREPILDGAAKRALLLKSATELGIEPEATLAVGDGANDLPMLEAAGLGIAFHANPHVYARIRNRIDHADLSALLYLQGYRAAEFAA